MQPEKSLNSSTLVDSHCSQSTPISIMTESSFVGSGSSLSPQLTDTNTPAVHASPQFSKYAGYVSPEPNQNDQSGESNTTYLKPDFYDPLVLTRSDPVCPSPLAMLAKTCQNIGHMMEASVNPGLSNISPTNARHVTSTIPTTNATATGSSLPSPMIAGASNNAAGTMQRLSPSNSVNKSPKQTKASSPTTDLKTMVNAKRSSVSRLKWAQPDPNGSFSINCHRTEAVSSSTSQSDLIPSVRMDGTTSGQKMHCTIPNSSSLSTAPMNSCPTANSAMGSIAFREATVGSSQQPTSNALAQLARLSSSLSLPDPPRSVNGLIEGLSKDRSNWNDPLRVQIGTKRFRRNSGTGLKGFPLVPNSCASGSKRTARDLYVHSHPVGESHYNGTNVTHNQSKLSVTNSSSYNNTTSRGSPQTEQSLSPNSTQITGNPWLALAEFLRQMMDQKADQTPRVPAQDTFSYNLARSFLDFFYSRMMTLTNNSVGTTLTNVPQIPPIKSPNTNVPPPYSHKDPLFPNLGSTLNRTPISNIPLGTTPSVGYTEPVSSAHSSCQGERCFFCGQTCASQTEWCLHIYTHIFQIEKGQFLQQSQNQHQNTSPVHQAQPQPHPHPEHQQLQQPQQNSNPLSMDLSDRTKDNPLSKFNSLPFPFCFPLNNSSSSSFSSPASLPDPLPQQKADADYMCMINSYISSWMEKQRDLNSAKSSTSFPLSFPDAIFNNPVFLQTNPAGVDFTSTRPDLQVPKCADPSMYMYWLYMYAACCSGNFPSRIGYPTPQQPLNHVPPSASTNTMGFPHSLMSAFGITGPGLGIFPKV